MDASQEPPFPIPTRPTPRQCAKACFWLPLSLPFYAFVLPVGFLFRPIWRVFLRLSVAITRRRNTKSKSADFWQSWLLLEERAAWSKVADWLEGVEDENSWGASMHTFASLYLHNNRLPEAIEAAQRAASMREAWIRAHPEDVRLAQEKAKQADQLGALRRQRKPDEPIDAERCKEEVRLLHEAHAHGQSFVRQYRDARIMLAALQWRHEHQDTVPSLHSRHRERHPFSPVLWGGVSRFAKRIGVPDAEFNRIRAEAEALSL